MYSITRAVLLCIINATLDANLRQGVVRRAQKRCIVTGFLVNQGGHKDKTHACAPWKVARWDRPLRSRHRPGSNARTASSVCAEERRGRVEGCVMWFELESGDAPCVCGTAPSPLYANHTTTVARKGADARLCDRVDAAEAVRVAGEQRRAVGGPGERQALRVSRVLADTGELGLELVDDRLALKVEDW